jgi:hypothetical protein
MSFYLINCDNKEINYNFDKVVIGRKIINENKSSKYYIYYQENNYSDIKDIFIKLPKIRTIYKLGSSKYYQDNIPIYPNYDLTNNFIEFIKLLELNIFECFVNKYPDIELNTIISKNNHISYLRTHINENIKINNELKISDLANNSEIDIIIKLNYIWNKENTIGLNTDLFQISYNQLPKQININKQINIDKVKISNSNNIINNDNLIDNNIVINKPISNPIRPSIADLNFAIKKLKPLNKTD